jgi:signal transduction histidine kinase
MVSPAELLQQLTQGLIADRHPQDLLTSLAQTLGALFAADAVALVQSIPGQTGIQAVYWHHQGGDTAAINYRPALSLNILDHPAIAKLFSKSNILAIQDLTAKASQHWLTGEVQEWLSVLSDRPGRATVPTPSRSLLAVVNRLDDCVNGMIAVMRSQPYEWMEADVQLLDDLAGPLAIAMSHAQFQQQVRQQRRYQQVIGQLVTAIRHTDSLDQIFEQALRDVVSTLQVSRGFILLLKHTERSQFGAIGSVRVSVAGQWPKACELPVPAVLGDVTENRTDQAGTWIHHTFPLSDCPACQQLYLHPQELWVTPVSLTSPVDGMRPLPSDIPADPMAGHRSPLNSGGMPALVLLPLESHGKVLGYLAVQHDQPCLWQTEELSFLKLVAAQVATAIIQSHTLQQVQSLVEERTAQLKHSLDVQAKLYTKTRQQIEQLQQLNQLKDEFLSTMSHELRTPLTSMTLAIRMLRQGNLSEERRQKYLDILEEQCAQETSLINDLLALQKIETGRAASSLQKLDAYHLIRSLAQTFDDEFASRNLSLTVDIPAQPLSVRTDADSLRRILTELFTNARKYAAVDTAVDLQARSVRSPEGAMMLQIVLRNLGDGIAAEDLPYIFDKFRRGRGITQQAIPGTGLGLALVKGLVEHLNGTIEVSSQRLEGGHGTPQGGWETCFRVTIPQG